MKRILTILICGISSLTFGQQIAQYSQYFRNQFQVNPGAAGVYDFLDVTCANRWQWVGFGGNPRTNYIGGSTVIGKPKVTYNPGYRVSQGPVRNPEVGTGKLKHAIGGQFYADQYGAFREIQTSVTYAIHLPVSDKYNLSFGTKLGMSNNQFMQDKAVVLNPTDPYATYAGGDADYDAYVQDMRSKYILNIDAGLYFYSNKNFLGVSATNLTKDMVSFGSGTANFDKQIHLQAIGGHKFKVNDNFTLMPAFLLKYMSPSPITIEGTLQGEYKEWLWAAVSYRNKDAIVGSLGLNVNNRFKFGYSYDRSVSQFQSLVSGGHEIVLGLMLGR